MPAPPEPVVSVRRLDAHYGERQALFGIDLDVAPNAVTALIGPSGCGKTTFLRCLNRMNELVEGARVSGRVLIEGQDVRDFDPHALRKRVGMVFQRPTPFSTSIYENVAYGPRIHGMRRKDDLDEAVERALRQAALWGEVKDRLHDGARGLSEGQQQRLSIARTLAVGPHVLLMDEPCSSLDPIATSRIEDLLFELKESLTILVVTHNLQQAQRASDFTGFFVAGRLVEFGATQELFLTPKERATEDYISGRFG